MGVAFVTTEELVGEEGIEGEGGQLLMLCRRVEWKEEGDERKASDTTAPSPAVLPVEDSKPRRTSLFRSARGKESPLIPTPVPTPPEERRVTTAGLNRQLSGVYHDMYAQLSLHMIAERPCYLAGVRSLIYVTTQPQ